jgi:hypothetical protein
MNFYAGVENTNSATFTILEKGKPDRVLSLLELLEEHGVRIAGEVFAEVDHDILTKDQLCEAIYNSGYSVVQDIGDGRYNLHKFE